MSNGHVIKARLPQNCQECGGPISIGDSITKKTVGWCHAFSNMCLKSLPEMRPEQAPPCPICFEPMVRRTNRSTFEPFWGCSKFGKADSCNGTRPWNENIEDIRGHNTPPEIITRPQTQMVLPQTASPQMSAYAPQNAPLAFQSGSYLGAPSLQAPMPHSQSENSSIVPTLLLLTQQLNEVKDARAAREAEIAKEKEENSAQIQRKLEEMKESEWKHFQREYPVPQYLEEYIFRRDDPRRCINIGVCGNSGVGKSALIKSILSQFASDEVSSPSPASSFQADGTRHPTPYKLSVANGDAFIWDLPGQGTETIPSKSYLREIGLKHFDALLIVTSDRVTENDKGLLSAVRHEAKWYAVVRTKIDLAVNDAREDHGLSVENALDKVRHSLVDQLNEDDLDRIHLVTSRAKYWDGSSGDPNFGRIDELCEELENLITDSLIELMPEDSISCISLESDTNNSYILVDTSGKAPGDCFLDTTLLAEVVHPIGNKYGTRYVPAQELREGTFVRGHNDNTMVEKVTTKEEVRKVVKLVTKNATLTVTNTHRVVVDNTARPSKTEAPSNLRKGDLVCCTGGPEPLLYVREFKRKVTIVEVVFKPDIPVQAFDMPREMILSKGKQEIRRGGMNRQPFGISLQGASSSSLIRCEIPNILASNRTDDGLSD